jgi:NADPH-dependent 7-cyano-7-deazaguanine reductase QueF-like protein
VNPSEIIRQIAELTQENSKGADALYAAEIELAELENKLDLIEAKAFIRNQGSVADRTALARLEASEARLERDVARAKVNRIKVKIKALESSLMATGTQARLLSAELKI